MIIDFVTKEDLQKFKEELLNDIEKIISNGNSNQSEEYLKSADVRKKLKISSGKLQTLRVNGTLKYKKLLGTIYYLSSDIDKLLQ